MRGFVFHGQAAEEAGDHLQEHLVAEEDIGVATAVDGAAEGERVIWRDGGQDLVDRGAFRGVVRPLRRDGTKLLRDHLLAKGAHDLVERPALGGIVALLLHARPRAELGEVRVHGDLADLREPGFQFRAPPQCHRGGHCTGFRGKRGGHHRECHVDAESFVPRFICVERRTFAALVAEAARQAKHGCVVGCEPERRRQRRHGLCIHRAGGIAGARHRGLETGGARLVEGNRAAVVAQQRRVQQL